MNIQITKSNLYVDLKMQFGHLRSQSWENKNTTHYAIHTKE